MIGKLPRKYILFGISAIRVRGGIAEVDSECRRQRLGLFGNALGCFRGPGSFAPTGLGVSEAPCPRAYALGYLLPSLREGYGDLSDRAIPP